MASQASFQYYHYPYYLPAPYPPGYALYPTAPIYPFYTHTYPVYYPSYAYQLVTQPPSYEQSSQEMYAYHYNHYDCPENPDSYSMEHFHGEPDSYYTPQPYDLDYDEQISFDLDNTHIIDQYLQKKKLIQDFCAINLDLIKKCREPEEVEFLLENITQHEIIMPIKISTGALKKYGKLRAYKKAVSLYRRIPDDEKDIMTKNTMLNIFGKLRDYKSAKKLYNEIPEEEKNIVTQNTMLKIYCDSHDYESAIKLYEQIPDHQKDIVTKTTMLKVYCESHKYELAIKLFHEIPEDQKDIIVYNTILNVYCESQDYQSAINIYNQIPDDQKDSFTYNTTLKVYCELKDYDSAIEIYHLMPKENINIITKNIMIKVLCQSGEYQEALDLFDQIPEHLKTQFTYNTMLNGFCYLQDYESARAFYEEIPKDKNNIITQNTMLKIYSESQQFDLAKEFYASIPEHKKSFITKMIIINVFILCNENESALKIFDLNPDIFTSETVSFDIPSLFCQHEINKTHPKDLYSDAPHLLSKLIVDKNPNIKKIIVGDDISLKNFLLEKYKPFISVTDHNPTTLHLNRKLLNK